MLISIKQLHKWRVAARDEELGLIDDVFFDDQTWTTRFIVVSTARLLGRDVLIVPDAVLRVDPEEGRVELVLSGQQVKDSPPVDFGKPVSRQKAEEYFRYYGWPYYGTAGFGFGALGYSVATPPVVPPPEQRGPSVPAQERGDPHMRSFRQVTGYKIRGRDQEFGHLEDLVVDQRHWTVRYLAVDTRNWWPGPPALVLPRSIERFDWREHSVHVGLTRGQIAQAPRWDEREVLDREDERRIHAHYGATPYWDEAAAIPASPPGG